MYLAYTIASYHDYIINEQIRFRNYIPTEDYEVLEPFEAQGLRLCS